MTEVTHEIGVVLARRETGNKWAPVAWRPVTALAAAPPLAPRSFISQTEGETLYYAGAFTLVFHSSETAHYRDNLRSGRPSIWVAMSVDADFPDVRMVTVDPYEGEALAEIYGEGLDAAPMPPTVQEALLRFVSEHHVERAFVKRKRT